MKILSSVQDRILDNLLLIITILFIISLSSCSNIQKVQYDRRQGGVSVEATFPASE